MPIECQAKAKVIQVMLEHLDKLAHRFVVPLDKAFKNRIIRAHVVSSFAIYNA